MPYPSTSLGPGGEAWIEWGKNDLHRYWDKHHPERVTVRDADMPDTEYFVPVKEKVEVRARVIRVELRDWQGSAEPVSCPGSWPPECHCTKHIDKVDYDVTVEFTVYMVLDDGGFFTSNLVEIASVIWTFGVFGEVRTAITVECAPPGTEDLPTPAYLASLAPEHAAQVLASRRGLASTCIPGWIGTSTMTRWIREEPVKIAFDKQKQLMTVSPSSFRQEVLRLPEMQRAQQEKLIADVLPILKNMFGSEKKNCSKIG